MKIKICGITNLEDALLAVQAGADLLGFNFYPKSPRYIDPPTCAAICSHLARSDPQIRRVGVFVNLPAKAVLGILDTCGLQLAQLSGDESLSDLNVLTGRAFKAVRLSADSFTLRDGQMDLTEENGLDAYLEARKNEAPAALVDASVPGKFGGTGQTADWGLAASLARRAPILLAGGLTPENVAEAVRKVRPWGVDVASGVEAGPGKKDPVKIRAFIQNARSAMIPTEIRIESASREDLPEILALQKLAYHSEAVLNQDFTIPALLQTQAEIDQEFIVSTFLKAIQGGRLIGSVRGQLQKSTCFIGRVIVHPDCQNLGIGTQLMQAIEEKFPQARRYELFTSERSRRDLFLYQKLGYRSFKQEKMNERVNLIYLEKNV